MARSMCLCHIPGMGKEHRPKRMTNRPLTRWDILTADEDDLRLLSEPYEPAEWMQAAARNSDPCPDWAVYEDQPRDLCEVYGL